MKDLPAATRSIRHFSFDLWLTLIKSNPVFKQERALLFYTRYNPQKKTLEQVTQIFRQVDLMCNGINEKTGNNIDAEEMYLMVLYHLSEDFSLFKGLDVTELYKEIEPLIFNFIPDIYISETYEVLDRLKQQSGTTLNILSNTGFIKGSTLRNVLVQLNLSTYFDFQIYSDEVGLSKPNTNVYKFLLKQIYALRKEQPPKLNEIMHIGDNPIADIHGAKAMGLQAFQINSNDKLITHLI